MTPSLSRKVGRIMAMPTITDMSLESRFAFVKRVQSKTHFKELNKKDQNMIKQGEKELKKLMEG